MLKKNSSKSGFYCSLAKGSDFWNVMMCILGESKTSSLCHVHNTRDFFFQLCLEKELIIGGVFSVHTFWTH